MALYEKFPLDHNRRQIRLLILQPGNWDDGIICDFRVMSLDQGPAYSALSYVWGTDAANIVVTVGGHQMLIRKSLFTALRRLRAHASSREVVLWADALCIDQTSIDERNFQVALMGRIYSNCKAVFIWLGEMDDIHESCPSVATDQEQQGRSFDVLEHVKKFDPEAVDRNPTIVLDALPESDVAICLATMLHLMSQHRPEAYRGALLRWNPKEDSHQACYHNAINYIINNSWFNRLWVVQEFVLAPEAIVFLGPVNIPIETITQARTNHRSYTRWPYYSGPYNNWNEMLLDDGLNNFVNMSEFQDLIHSRTDQISLVRLRFQLSKRHATEDLDQVYALLGMFEYLQQSQLLEGEEHDLGMILNYSSTPKDYYAYVAQLHIEKTHLLLPEFLPVSEATGLPSWAIDWTMLQSEDMICNVKLWSEMYGLFNAGDALGDSTPVFFKDQGIEKILQIKGCLVDTIVRVVPHGENSVSADLLTAFVQDVDPESLYTGTTNQTWSDAWFATILADCVGTSSQTKLTPGLHRLTKDTDIEGIQMRGKYLLQAHNPWLAPKDRRDFTEGSIRDGDGEWGRYLHSVVPPHSPENIRIKNLSIAIKTHAKDVLRGRTMYRTAKGYLGVGTKCKPGDEIFVVTCGNMPIVVEADKTDTPRFRLVGNSYLHGFMDGEHNARLLDESGGLKKLMII